MHSERLSALVAELQVISPMPGDEELEALSEEGSRRLDKYVELVEEIRQETKTVFPLEVISVLLSSFGTGDGFEAYWSTLHLIESFPDKHSLYFLIQKASSSPNPGTRKWCCLLLGRRRNIEDLPFLLDRLKDDIPAVRTEALLFGIGMLAQVYPVPQAIPLVNELLNDEDKLIRKYAGEVMAQLQTWTESE
jgi:HEAT repeat protein